VLAAVDDIHGVELSDVEAIVGGRSFQRGRSYARGNRVLALRWDADANTLTGSVVGKGALYETGALFARDRDGSLVLQDGECTCPVGYNCKHVAAIVIAAIDGHGAGGRAVRGSRAGERGAGELGARRDGDERGASEPQERNREQRQAADLAQGPAPRKPSWEEPLRALVEPVPGALGAATPLAIELSLRAGGSSTDGSLRLIARLMRPGARGGWINGSLSWGTLDSWQLRGGDYRADHLALIRELAAVHRARDAHGSYYYGYSGDKTLDLGDCESPQLWSLLEEAARIDLKLVHARAELGEVPRCRQGEIVIDVTQDDEAAALLTAAIRIDSEDDVGLEPLLFIGRSGHGVVCAERSDVSVGNGIDAFRLRLVRLARRAPTQLQRMVLDGQRIRIPVDELDRFTQELCPALRSVASVCSSDGSFTPPEISAPALVLRAGYGAGHAVSVGWEWVYRIDDVEHRVSPAGNGATPLGLRDIDAERAILADTALTGAGLDRIGLVDESGRPIDGSAALLGGMESVRFTTEDLPALVALPGVEVAVEGEPPDYRDVGDSLSIGVSTGEVAGERDWFDLGVSISVEGRELPFAEVFAALARGEDRMLLDDGVHFSLFTPKLQELRRLIEEAAALSDAPPDQLRISRYQAGLWAELVALGVVRDQAQAWKRQVSALLEMDAPAAYEPPATLNAQLRPYQREGFGWLAMLWELELGGILADDMGLGKTLQVLALICHARGRDSSIGPFLVVAPTSVVSNWVNEAARFAPDLNVDVVTDTLARSARAIEDVAAADVVVTTYTLFRLEFEAYRAVKWAGAILDEAQYVKNHQAKTYKCVRQLDTPFKLAMTGTPMENNLMELWSLLSIAAPGLFPDPARFGEQFARPIERGGDGERLERMRRRIKPLMKRRTKELVAADLPAKQEQMLEVDLHPRHRKLYDTRLQRERQKILGLIDDFNRHRFTILRSITLLRQLSLHAGLVDDAHDSVPCAKVGALVEHLEDVLASKHRALVFSQFTGFLAKVRERLDKEGIGYCYLDGRTRKRENVIERFKKGDDPVFLISLKAGGFGLNLTEADYCFLLDPWWNPATEAQAIDRTHRIGQTRPVNVYRMIARDTIEEKVAALARRKAALFTGVMDNGDLFASSLTAQDIRGLLS